MLRMKTADSIIWMIKHHQIPHACPECKSENNFTYIGFAETYTEGMYGKFYICNRCDTWIDCVWPKWLGRMTNASNLQADDKASV